MVRLVFETRSGSVRQIGGIYDALPRRRAVPGPRESREPGLSPAGSRRRPSSGPPGASPRGSAGVGRGFTVTEPFYSLYYIFLKIECCALGLRAYPSFKDRF